MEYRGSDAPPNAAEAGPKPGEMQRGHKKYTQEAAMERNMRKEREYGEMERGGVSAAFRRPPWYLTPAPPAPTAWPPPYP